MLWYPDHLDDSEYKKADPQSGIDLSSMIDDADFDQISIEDKHCCNDLDLRKFKKKAVILGACHRSQVRSKL